MTAPTTDDPAGGAKPMPEPEPLDHTSSYLAIGRSRISARGVGFLILCISIPAVMLTALHMDIDDGIMNILVGAYATSVGSAMTAYFQQAKK